MTAAEHIGISKVGQRRKCSPRVFESGFSEDCIGAWRRDVGLKVVVSFLYAQLSVRCDSRNRWFMLIICMREIQTDASAAPR